MNLPTSSPSLGLTHLTHISIPLFINFFQSNYFTTLFYFYTRLLSLYIYIYIPHTHIHHQFNTSLHPYLSLSLKHPIFLSKKIPKTEKHGRKLRRREQHHRLPINDAAPAPAPAPGQVP